MAYDLKPLQRLVASRDKITAKIEEEMRAARAAGVKQGDIAAAAGVTRETVRVACLPEPQREAWRTRRRKPADE